MRERCARWRRRPWARRGWGGRCACLGGLLEKCYACKAETRGRELTRRGLEEWLGRHDESGCCIVPLVYGNGELREGFLRAVGCPMDGFGAEQKSAQLQQFQSRITKRRDGWKRASEIIRACLALRVAMNPVADPCFQAKHGALANHEAACAHVTVTEDALLIGSLCRRRSWGGPAAAMQGLCNKQPRRHTGTDLDASSAKHVNTHYRSLSTHHTAIVSTPANSFKLRTPYLHYYWHRFHRHHGR
jgi:hypothetical protein